MGARKVLGIAINGQDVKNYNIAVVCRYETTSKEIIKKEALFAIATTDRETATRLAIEKARRVLNELPHVVKTSVSVEKKERERNGTNKSKYCNNNGKRHD